MCFMWFCNTICGISFYIRCIYVNGHCDEVILASGQFGPISKHSGHNVKISTLCDIAIATLIVATVH